MLWLQVDDNDILYFSDRDKAYINTPPLPLFVALPSLSSSHKDLTTSQIHYIDIHSTFAKNSSFVIGALNNPYVPPVAASCPSSVVGERHHVVAFLVPAGPRPYVIT